jgi:hypothetical protein
VRTPVAALQWRSCFKFSSPAAVVFVSGCVQAVLKPHDAAHIERIVITEGEES